MVSIRQNQYLLLISLAVLQNCAKPVSSTTEASVSTKKSSAGSSLTVPGGAALTGFQVDWGVSPIQSIESFAKKNPGTNVSLSAIGFENSGSATSYCFENSFDGRSGICAQAMDIQNSTAARKLGSDGLLYHLPVLIRGFELNVTKKKCIIDGGCGSISGNWNSVVLEKASFTTAKLSLNKTTGVFSLSQFITEQRVSGQTCDVNEENSIGLVQNTSTAQPIIGIDFHEQPIGGIQNENSYINSIISGGRAVYYGIKETSLLSGEKYAFEYAPNSQENSASQIFGGFSSSQFLAALNPPSLETSDSNILALPYLGWKSSDTRRPGAGSGLNEEWRYHVLVGFCIKGTKSDGTRSYPLIFKSKVRLIMPKMTP